MFIFLCSFYKFLKWVFFVAGTIFNDFFVLFMALHFSLIFFGGDDGWGSRTEHSHLLCLYINLGVARSDPPGDLSKNAAIRMEAWSVGPRKRPIRYRKASAPALK